MEVPVSGVGRIGGGEGFAKECNVLECVSASSLLVSGSNVN